MGNRWGFFVAECNKPSRRLLAIASILEETSIPRRPGQTSAPSVLLLVATLESFHTCLRTRTGPSQTDTFVPLDLVLVACSKVMG